MPDPTLARETGRAAWKRDPYDDVRRNTKHEYDVIDRVKSRCLNAPQPKPAVGTYYNAAPHIFGPRAKYTRGKQRQ